MHLNAFRLNPGRPCEIAGAFAGIRDGTLVGGGTPVTFQMSRRVTQGYIFKWLDTGRATTYTSLKRFSSALTMPSRSAVLFD
jgi:hypothetical protein